VFQPGIDGITRSLSGTQKNFRALGDELDGGAGFEAVAITDALGDGDLTFARDDQNRGNTACGITGEEKVDRGAE
jgi:hypothetical protein